MRHCMSNPGSIQIHYHVAYGARGFTQARSSRTFRASLDHEGKFARRQPVLYLRLIEERT